MYNFSVGDRVSAKPVFPGGDAAQTAQIGTIVYIHPEERFATVEFPGIFGRPRECFRLDDLEKRK